MEEITFIAVISVGSSPLSSQTAWAVPGLSKERLGGRGPNKIQQKGVGSKFYTQFQKNVQANSLYFLLLSRRRIQSLWGRLLCSKVLLAHFQPIRTQSLRKFMKHRVILCRKAAQLLG